MNRRGQAVRYQQLQHRTRRWPIQRSTSPAESAGSPVPSLRAARSNSASAPSHHSHHSQPVILRLCALERVSPDVLVLILQYLDGRHKLTAVSRLSRAFRPLPALAFLHDPAGALLGIHYTVFERLHLYLSVDKPEQPGRLTVFSCPRSLRCLPHLRALTRVDITMSRYRFDDWTPSLRCILRSVLSLPALERLDIVADVLGSKQLPDADWTDSALPTAVSLRHLKLGWLSLSAASFHRLCSLPLTSLYWGHCTVQADSDDDALVSAAQLSRSGLTLFECIELPSRAVLSSIAVHAPQLRHLHILDCVVDLYSGTVWDVSPLLTASGSPRLLHLTTLCLPRMQDPHQWDVSCTLLEQAMDAANQQLVAAYSAQLTSLTFIVLSGSSLSAWLNLLMRCCSQLDELSIRAPIFCAPGSEPRPWLIAQPEPAENSRTLPGLQKLKELYLCDLPLTDDGLMFLLSGCPELEKCHLRCPQVTTAGREAALRCCPKVSECTWM